MAGDQLLPGTSLSATALEEVVQRSSTDGSQPPAVLKSLGRILGRRGAAQLQLGR